MKSAILAMAAALATGGTLTLAVGESQRSAIPPFAGLDELPHVVTSRDEYRIWLHWSADEFEAQYPDGRPPFDRAALDPDELGPRLTLSCRADNRGESLRGAEDLRTDAHLPMHPEAPDVPGPLNPWYRLRAWYGGYGEWEEWPARIRLDGVEEEDGKVRRQRMHYSFARPELQIVGVSGSAAEGLARIAAGDGWRLRIDGDGLRVDATFAALPEATRAAAARMRRRCPDEQNAAGR